MKFREGDRCTYAGDMFAPHLVNVLLAGPFTSGSTVTVNFGGDWGFGSQTVPEGAGYVVQNAAGICVFFCAESDLS